MELAYSMSIVLWPVIAGSDSVVANVTVKYLFPEAALKTERAEI